MKVYNFKYTDKDGWQDLPEVDKVDHPNTLLLVFAAPEYLKNPEPFKELQGLFSKSIIMGCSTSGEILGDRISDASIVVSAIHFENSKIRLVSKEISDSEQSYEVGKSLGEKLYADDLKGALILSDGLNANGSYLIKGFNENIDPTKVSVSGGLAGDGSRFQKTWVIDDGAPKEGIVTAVGMYGEKLVFSNSTRGGWDIFGPERVITKSKGNVLYEIDGRPALDLYKEYLGEKAKDLPASGLLFPLQIRPEASSDKRLVRTILAVDEATQSMTFAGNVPEGYSAQLMRANFDRVIDGASEAGDDSHEYLLKKCPTLVGKDQLDNCVNIAISCVGRRLVLGERADEEVEALFESVGEKNLIGFYSYGELAPHIQGSACDLQNQSMTVMSFLEVA